MYHVVADSPVSRRIRSPSWLDLRLVAGVVLVLACVVLGVRVVSSADRTSRFWAASHNLAAGVVLQSSDLHAVAVRLPSDSAGYEPVGTDVVGKALTRPIGAGELVPRSALDLVAPATTVTIPLGGDDAPKISPGQRITLWVSTKQCPSATVLNDVAVQSVQNAHASSLSASDGEDLIVRVTPALAQRVVEALALTGGVLRAGILDGAAPSTSPSLPDLSGCTGTSP